MRYVWQSKKWPHFNWNNGNLVETLGKTRLIQGKLISRVEALGLDLSQEARAEILADEAIKTAAIEGQNLSADSVRSSVARRLGLAQVGLANVDRQVDGLVQVLLDASVNHNKALTARRLHGWHAALFPTGYSGLQMIQVGKWRPVNADPMQVLSGPIGREKIHFEAPPAKQVSTEMKQFFVWWQESIGKSEGLLRAALAHFYFVTIHPYEDGNGRLARALTDMALAQDENLEKRFYSLSSQIMRERDEYYSVLESTQKSDGDITQWLLWFLQCAERAIVHSETLIATVLFKGEFWNRHAQTPLNERQRKVVNRLLDAGPGGFEGGLTTRKYVSLARVSRATAYREIADLVQKNLLHPQQGKGRNVSYDLTWESFTH
jgi:Fic family protein